MLVFLGGLVESLVMQFKNLVYISTRRDTLTHEKFRLLVSESKI